MKRRDDMSNVLIAIALAVVLVWAGVASATPITMADHNSTVTVDPTSQGGMSSWRVDGRNQLFQQWFWYRVGPVGPEASLDTLSVVSTLTGTRVLDLQFTSPDFFTVDVTYLLTGGSNGSNTSDIAETIRINNIGNSELDFHFFQYSDFDLGASARNDTAVMTNANAIQQSDPDSVLAETVVAPSASHHQIDLFPLIRNSLRDGSPTTLSDNPAIGTALGPGDVAWAFQWDRKIAANGTFIISKDKNIAPVPEPASLLLLGAGLVGLAAYGRKKMLKG